jgi:alpha-tubulin suppressor-like RCC1 family protein
VAAGALHTCVAVETGEVFCWGANDRGQLGARGALSACEAGGTSVACARTPVRVADVTDAVEVAAGDAHTCARTRDGRVWCWGTNTDGQLGAGTASESPTPRAQVVLLGASALRQVRSLAAGGDHTCATRDDGAVLCWGRHDRGQVGVAVPESFAPCAHACVRTAVPIAGFEGAPLPEDPDAGFEDFDGALEPADAASEDVAPESAEPPPTARVIAAGGAFSCLTLSDGTVRCWGTNRSYELGNGRMNEGGAALTTVIASPGSAATNSLQGAVHVESGAATSCVVSANRALKCWGSNEFGALGVGNTVEQNGPVPVTW